MKKYYCPNCKQFKNRFQLKKENDTRVAYFTCRWCHNSHIYEITDVLHKLIEKLLTKEDFTRVCLKTKCCTILSVFL